MQRKKTVVIIGCGISGASSADEFLKRGYQVKILEKEDRLGGKICSARDFATKGGAPELGAMVMTSNYPAVDTVVKHNIEVLPVLLSDDDSVNEVVFGKKNPSFGDYAKYGIKFAWQSVKFSYHVWTYNSASNQLANKSPLGQSDTFDKFCEMNGLDAIARLQKIWVPGMGYGDLQHNRTYRILNYMGYFTMPSLMFGPSISHHLLTVKNGYQTVVEKMVEGMDVETSITINRIERNAHDESGVKIYYTNINNEQVCVNADYLVLTMSPYYWKDLNMDLTPIEQRCVNELRRVPYSTAVVDIENFSGKHTFVPEALDAKGFGHVGFISTKGEGRCVVYVNRDPADDTFSLAEGSEGRETMIADLRKLGYDNVTVLKTRDWPDYNSSISWELGMELEHQQGKNNTVYVGTFRPTSFESVAAAETSARNTTRRLVGVVPSHVEAIEKGLTRAYNFFFKLPRVVPSTHVGAQLHDGYKQKLAH